MEQRTLKGKTAFITGGSRGIGREIALRCARDGANVVIAAKSAEPHPTLPGTIHTVAAEIEAAGGRALPLQMDVRNEDEIRRSVETAAATFGGIDVLVNNASAISPTKMEETPLKKYDLLQAINTRGTFAATQACIPWLKKAANPHVLTLSPPLQADPYWYGQYLAYCISKFGMSMVTLGVAEEFRPNGIAANSLWPRTMIGTDAVRVHYGKEYRGSRKPAIMADAAYLILTSDSRAVSGQCFIDEQVLAAHGVTDLSGYALEPGMELAPDILI